LAEIFVGLQTSADKIYIFEPEDATASTFKFSKNGSICEIEKAICLPAIYDLTFGLFDSISSNAQIIFPYSVENGKAEVFEEEYFRKDFPLAWSYLESFKDHLVKRSLQGNDPKWYQFGRSQSLTRFQANEKLIWSVLATNSPYALDTNNLQFTGGGNGPYYALINNSDYSLLYFMGILSHPLFECMVKSGSSEFRGNYYSHGKQFIENLPIRTIESDSDKALYSNIIKTVAQLIESKSSHKAATYGAKRTIIERKMVTLNQRLFQSINELYGITDGEFQAVLNDEMFTTEVTNED
jgi:hypothetical protein